MLFFPGLIGSPRTSTSYSLSRSAANVDEGSSVTITLNTVNIANGTQVPYSIAGVSSGDINGASLTGYFTVTSNTDSKTFNVTADAATEGMETLVLSLDNGEASVSVAINDISLSPSYGIARSASSVNEGDQITFTLNTTNIDDGTLLAYTITGITSADIGGTALTGYFTVTGNTDSLVLTTTADSLTEGDETLTISLDNGQASNSVTIVDTSMTPTYALGRSAATVNEGDTVTITLTTTNVANGTTVPYTISGINGGDLSSGTQTGSFTVNSNTATLDFTFANDATTEGTEVMQLDLDNGQATVSVTILDTSLPPTYNLSRSASNVDEGNTITFTLTTTNVTNGTTVPYTITGVTTGDIAGASLTGNFTVNSNTAGLTLTATADATTEGAETITVTLDNGQSSISATINDTSQAASNVVFETTFTGLHGETTVVDTTGRHTASMIGNCTVVDTFNGYGAYDGDSSAFCDTSATGRIRVDATANNDFIFPGDFSIRMYGISEDTLSTERVLFGDTLSDSPSLSANQPSNFSVRWVGSSQTLRLYSGTTLLTSGTATMRTSGWSKVELKRVGTTVSLLFNNAVVGSTITSSAQWGGGVLTFGGWSTANKIRGQYYDFIKVTKG